MAGFLTFALIVLFGDILYLARYGRTAQIMKFFEVSRAQGRAYCP